MAVWRKTGCEKFLAIQMLLGGLAEVISDHAIGLVAKPEGTTEGPTASRETLLHRADKSFHFRTLNRMSINLPTESHAKRSC